MSSWHNDKCSPTLKNYKSARQDGDTFPDTASQIRSANDTPLPGFLTAGAVRLGAAARSSAGRRLKLRLQRLPISLEQITSSSSGSGDEGSVTSLGALHQALEAFRWTVRPQSPVGGEIRFRLQRVCEQAQPPQDSAAWGSHIASLLS